MSKAVYLSERGEDKNDGLSLEKAVLTGKRAVAIALKERRVASTSTGMPPTSDA